MSNCGEWRVIEYPDFINTNRDYTKNSDNNNYYYQEQQRRQFNTHNQTKNNQTNNNHLRRNYDIQDNHFSSDDRYNNGNHINHQIIQFPYQSYNDRYFNVLFYKSSSLYSCTIPTFNKKMTLFSLIIWQVIDTTNIYIFHVHTTDLTLYLLIKNKSQHNVSSFRYMDYQDTFSFIWICFRVFIYRKMKR